MERLAALEAEVKADAEAKQQRREAAMAKVKAERASQQAERDSLRERQAAIVTKKALPAPADDDEEPPRKRSRSSDVGTALELASKAGDVKHELSKPLKPGEKSWLKSAAASTLLGPLGWLYAGSIREAAPASALWLAFAAIASKLPTILLFPVLMVALPLSGLAGLLYAVQYNRNGGKRQRLFGDKKKKKELPGT